jgi:hypothetical protein
MTAATVTDAASATHTVSAPMPIPPATSMTGGAGAGSRFSGGGWVMRLLSLSNPHRR